jgi:hypothetical protein
VQLNEGRAKSEKRLFQLHLCFCGKRATSAPVEADVEPRFNQAFIFPFADLPTTPADWDELVHRHGALLHLCLTLNDAPVDAEERLGGGSRGYRELVASAVLDWRHVLTRQDQVFGLELQVRLRLLLRHGALETCTPTLLSPFTHPCKAR